MITEPNPDRELESLKRLCRTLLEADWSRDDGPICFSDRLALGDLAASAFFHNARLLLLTIAEAGTVRATATGNLNRALVAELFPQLQIAPLLRKTYEKHCRVIDESRLRGLHFPRMVAEMAGLLRRRAGNFSVTKAGLALLGDDRAGALYRTLFLTRFQDFNLAYATPHPDQPAVQESLAVTLWRLDDIARGWLSVQDMAKQVFLPAVYGMVEEAALGGYWTPDDVLINLLLVPLWQFGLLRRRKTDEWPGIERNDSIRLSPLWRKFISFPGL